MFWQLLYVYCWVCLPQVRYCHCQFCFHTRQLKTKALSGKHTVVQDVRSTRDCPWVLKVLLQIYLCLLSRVIVSKVTHSQYNILLPKIFSLVCFSQECLSFCLIILLRLMKLNVTFRSKSIVLHLHYHLILLGSYFYSFSMLKWRNTSFTCTINGVFAGQLASRIYIITQQSIRNLTQVV